MEKSKEMMIFPGICIELLYPRKLMMVPPSIFKIKLFLDIRSLKIKISVFWVKDYGLMQDETWFYLHTAPIISCGGLIK